MTATIARAAAWAAKNFGQQGGADVISRCGLIGAAPQVADQALQLLLAPNAPVGKRDLLLMPDPANP